jgi:hypothetical protein
MDVVLGQVGVVVVEEVIVGLSVSIQERKRVVHNPA